jgi:di/tricarboxylate transporter
MNFRSFLNGLLLLVVTTLVLVVFYMSNTSTSQASLPLVGIPPATGQSRTENPNIRRNDPIKDLKTKPSDVKKKIAYAITITKDGPFLDGALVLGYSAQIAQRNSSKYSPELIAFVTPEVVKARVVLAKYGWKILEKNLPVELHEIQNKDYMDRVNLLCLSLSLSLSLSVSLTDSLCRR